VIRIAKSTVHEIISDLNFCKVSTCWVPKMLIKEHKSKRMAALLENLCCYQDEGESFVESLVTGDETWVYEFTPELTSSGGTIFSVEPKGNARSWIYVRNHINALSLLEFCSRDGTIVRMTYRCRGRCEGFIITSAYFPYDSDEPLPTKELRYITGYCCNR
jgi:hypothetical protein